MKKTTKIVTLILLLSIMVLLCVGCGTSSNTNSTGTGNNEVVSGPAWWQVGLLDYDLTEEELTALIDDYYFDENGDAIKENGFDSLWLYEAKSEFYQNGEWINKYSDEFIEYIEDVEITGYTISTINLWTAGLSVLGYENEVELDTHYLVEFIPTGYMICKKNNFTSKVFYPTESPCAILGIDYEDIYVDINIGCMYIESEPSVFSSIDYQAWYCSGDMNPYCYFGRNTIPYWEWYGDYWNNPEAYECYKNFRFILGVYESGEYTSSSQLACYDEGYYESIIADKEISYEVAYGGAYNCDITTSVFDDDDVLVDIVTRDVSANVIINSVAELEEFCAGNGHQFFNEEDDNYNSTLSQTMRAYDDEFFAEQSLILIIYEQGNTQLSVVDAVYFINDNINIVLEKQGDEDVSYPCVITTFLFAIEVNQVDIVDVQEITTRFI